MSNKVAAWGRSRRRSCTAEDGDDRDRGSTAIEALLTIPVIVLACLLIIQGALLWHGRHVAQQAAHAGAVAAAAWNASAAEGERVTRDYLQQVAPTLLQAPTVIPGRDIEWASITVTAHVTSPIPFASFDVSASATVPVERFDQ